MASGKYIPGSDPSVFLSGKQRAAARGASMPSSPDTVFEGGQPVYGIGVPSGELNIGGGTIDESIMDIDAGAGTIYEAGLGALIPLAIGLGSKALPWIGGLLGGLGLGGLFGDEGETGGDSLNYPSSNGQALPVPIGGPGLAEPGGPALIKEWHVTYPKGRAQFYMVQRFGLRGKPTKYVMMYKTWDKTWTWWRMPTPSLAVIGKNMPSHRMLTRLRRNMKRHTDDAKTILKITSPTAYAKQLGYRKYAKHHRR